MAGLATAARLPVSRLARTLARLRGAGRGARRPPPVLLAAGIAVGAAAALPAAYLAITVGGEAAAAWETVWSSRTLGIALRTAGLLAAVTATAIAIAVPLAWLTMRTDLPAPRLWATLTTLPLVIPSYVGAYLFVSALGPTGLLQGALEPLGIERLPTVYGFAGAWLVLSLFTYPLVLITVRGALARVDPQLEEAARAMGRGPWEVFATVVLPQLTPAIGAGGLLVALYVLSDFGAVSIMRFDSFTREIYVTYQSSFDRTAAAALGVLLVGFMLVLLAVGSRLRRATRHDRAGPGVAAPPRRVPLGRWRAPALALCAALVGVALVAPVGVLGYWAAQGLGTDLGWSSIAANAANSLLMGLVAAGLAAALAIVVAILAVRYPRPLSTAIERLGYTSYALPGIVVALALVFFATRVAPPIYQTLALLAFALTIHYLPLAIGAVGSSLLQVPPRVEDAARGLGRGPLEVFRTVTTPLVASGVLAGAALVFLHAVKELPATLLLAPIGFETLATDIWRQTSAGFFEAGAIPSLALLAISAPVLYLLTARGAEVR